MIAEALKVILKFQCQTCDILEREGLGRVEVIHNVIGLIKMWSSRMHLMQFEAGQVGQPSQGRWFGCQHVVLLFLTQDYVLQPFWRPLGSIFLKERFSRDAFRKPQKGKRSAFEMR